MTPLTFSPGKMLAMDWVKIFGALLVKQARYFAGVPCCFVDRPGFVAFLNDALDGTIADQHVHIINCGVVRQWKNVDRLDRVRRGVLKFLRYIDPGKKAADFGLDIGMLQRALRGWLTFSQSQQGTLRDSGKRRKRTRFRSSDNFG